MIRTLLCLSLVVAASVGCKRNSAQFSPAPEAPAAPPNPAVDLKALNDAVRAHVMGLLSEPATLEDLVKSGMIKRLPTSPPGKKYVLSPDRGSVLLVNQ